MNLQYLLCFFTVLITVTCVSANVSSNCSTVWSNVVFVNQSLSIPYGSCLSIQDSTTVVFLTYEHTQEPISISISGSVHFGWNVVLESLVFYNGSYPKGSISTDQWGFNILSNSTQQTLRISSTFRKLSSNSMPTFTLQKSIPTNIADAIVEGGDAFFLLRTNSSVKSSLARDSTAGFIINNCEFRNMTKVLDMDARLGVDQSFLGYFGNGIFVGGSEFVNIENPITIFGVQTNSQSVWVQNSRFRNVVRAVYTNNELKFDSSLIENFSIGLQANRIIATLSTFTQTESPNQLPCKAIVNADLFNNTGSFWIQSSSFLGIYGVAVSVQNAEVFQFEQCLTKKCKGVDVPFIFIRERVDRVTFLQNRFYNNSIPLNHLISLNDIKMDLQFYYNTIESNIAKSILNIQQLKINSRIYRNIFDNHLTEYEIYFSNPPVEKFDCEFNYWGTNKTGEGLSILQLNELIRKKVFPPNNPNIYQIPYFLSSNVNDKSPSNLGGIIVLDSSGNNEENDMVMEAVLGCVGGFAFLMAFVIGITAVVVVCVKRRRNSKYLIIQN